MKDIAIYGAGGLGREIAWLIKQINSKKPTWNFIGFFDDGKEINSEISGFGKILGGIHELNCYSKVLNLILAFGNPNTIKSIREKIINPKVIFPNIIATTALLADTFQMGEGNIITTNCIFSINNKIGSFNLFDGATATGHDVEIGDYNVFMPGARISGGVKLGNLNLIGSGSFIVQNLKIGNSVTLGPMSVLLSKPKDDSTYIGNPAKIFRF